MQLTVNVLVRSFVPNSMLPSRSNERDIRSQGNEKGTRARQIGHNVARDTTHESNHIGNTFTAFIFTIQTHMAESWSFCVVRRPYMFCIKHTARMSTFTPWRSIVLISEVMAKISELSWSRICHGKDFFPAMIKF